MSSSPLEEPPIICSLLALDTEFSSRCFPPLSTWETSNFFAIVAPNRCHYVWSRNHQKWCPLSTTSVVLSTPRYVVVCCSRCVASKQRDRAQNVASEWRNVNYGIHFLQICNLKGCCCWCLNPLFANNKGKKQRKQTSRLGRNYTQKIKIKNLQRKLVLPSPLAIFSIYWPRLMGKILSY